MKINITLLPVVMGFMALASSSVAQEAVHIEVRPDSVLAISTAGGQSISVDLQLSNRGDQDLQLVRLEVTAYDETDALLFWRRMEGNGTRPALNNLGPLDLPAGGEAFLFIPTFSMPLSGAPHRVRFDLGFVDRARNSTTVHVDVWPQQYAQASTLSLPVIDHQLWVYDGADDLSHHRRLDLTDPFNRDVMGLRTNGSRYAMDLVVTDQAGRAFQGSPSVFENWFGYGAPITAPAPGRVVAVEAAMDDDMPFDDAQLAENPLLMLGNYVIIDHENGEYSMLAHFKAGSVAVVVGDEVSRGEFLGEMGASGMGVGLVHVHYELRSAAGLKTARGLPAYFQEFSRIEGRNAVLMRNGLLESGGFVRSP